MRQRFVFVGSFLVALRQLQMQVRIAGAALRKQVQHLNRRLKLPGLHQGLHRFQSFTFFLSLGLEEVFDYAQ